MNLLEPTVRDYTQTHDWLQDEQDQDRNYTQRNMFAYLIHIRTEEGRM